ncbi:NBPF family member NBPF8 isoform X3 [Macaca mulatta]
MQKLPHSVHQEQPHTVWADRKSCQIQQPLKIRMVKQNNIIPGEIQILLRFTGWESKVNVKKQPPVGIKCEPMDQGEMVEQKQGWACLLCPQFIGDCCGEEFHL